MLVCYTGGGTLGHVIPALAVHEALLDTPSYHALWIGREEPSERETVEHYGIPFFPIRWGKLRRYPSFRNILDIGSLVVAFFQALGILRKQRPDVLFSKGGFVSVPPVFAAYMLHIPVVSHESDATAGLATRINARFSRAVCVPYTNGFSSLRCAEIVVTGNPMRKSLVETSLASSVQRPAFLEIGEPLILILGGSSGSLQINTLVRNTLDSLTGIGYVYHQCGRGDVQQLKKDHYQEVPFITDELPQLLHAATVVVSRAGANTIAELALFGCPSLLIPLGSAASRGDQIDNARYLEREGAAMVLYPEHVDAKNFLEAIASLVEDGVLRKRFHDNIKSLSDATSAYRVATVLKTVKESSCSGV